ncbi:hypothetical protein Tco_0811268 [Tanacetum coccineum]
MPSPRPAAYSLREVMYRFYHAHLTSGDGFDPESKKIPSRESKVHIEVLSVLWGNRLPIPDGSLPFSRTPDVTVFKKFEAIPEVEIRLLALSVRTPDVTVFKKFEGIPEVEIRLLALSVRTPDVSVV